MKKLIVSLAILLLAVPVFALDYLTSIYDIQYTINPAGNSPLAGQNVSVRGIVTARFGSNYYTIAEMPGGPWHGIWVKDSSHTPNIGDQIQITATVTEVNGLTTLDNLTTYQLLSSGNQLPVGASTTGYVSREDWEGVLVTMNNVTVTNPDLGYGEWEVNDGSGTARIDDLASYAYTPVAGDQIATLTGVVTYSYGNYKVEPRSDADIEIDDGDGVATDIENAAPNGGDGNGDGILDGRQGNVVSLPSATGRGYITIVTSDACASVRNVLALEENPDDASYNFPFGLVSFTLPCPAAHIRIYFHGTTNLDNFTYRKHGPLPPYNGTPTWYTMPDVITGTTSIGGQDVAYVEFDLRDGQIGDDTGIDGLIVDVGGPGLQATAAVIAPVPTLNEWGLIIFALILGITAFGSIRMKAKP